MLAKNVFEAILKYGHDEDFDPFADAKFLPTDAPAGSQEKIEVLRRRVELGQPLWHKNDRVDYSGLTGAIQPREDGQEDQDGTSGPDTDISVELNGTEGADSASDLDSAFQFHSDESSLKLPKVSRGLGGFIADMRAKQNHSLQEGPAEIDFSRENRGKLKADIAEAVKPILSELRLALTNKLRELAEYSPRKLSPKQNTQLVYLVNTVAIGREYSTLQAKLLANRLGKTEREAHDLMQGALISMRPKFFELLLKQSLNEEVAGVVRYAQSFFKSSEHGEPTRTTLSIQSKSATVLLGIGGLPACILEAGRSLSFSHGSPSGSYKKSAARDANRDSSSPQALDLAEEAPKSAEPVNLRGTVFENITLDKETCKNLAKDLWAKLQEDPKKLYSTALELPADEKLLSGESEHEYFNRVFLLGLRGNYKSLENSNYPSILHPLAQNKLDSYFKDNFFWNLNQHFGVIKEAYRSSSCGTDVQGSERSIFNLIYNAIPLELFNIWSPDALWEPVLTRRLSKQLKPMAIARDLAMEGERVSAIWNRICRELTILRPICNSDTFRYGQPTLTSP